jgi:RNA 2',3'-cyclic 3'-phosphodiesterase
MVNNQSAEQIRSFIAIELPEEVKTGLKQVQALLSSASQANAKWVDPDSIHLTLKFLGNVDAGKLELVGKAMEDAASTTGPLNLELKGLGAFPNLKRVQIVWVGVTGDLERLQALQETLETNLEPLGFPPEGRAFTPHLTLARVRDFATPAERQALGDLISRTQIESNLIIKASSISLMKSQLTRSGAVYTELRSAELKSPCQ